MHRIPQALYSSGINTGLGVRVKEELTLEVLFNKNKRKIHTHTPVTHTKAPLRVVKEARSSARDIYMLVRQQWGITEAEKSLKKFKVCQNL